jgi:hypothetical protein
MIATILATICHITSTKDYQIQRVVVTYLDSKFSLVQEFL